MTLTEAEQKIVKTVVSKFLSLKECTVRRELLREFEDLDALDRLVRYSLIKTSDNLEYFPRALGFYYCGDDAVRDLARESANLVLPVLKSLFLEPVEKEYVPTEIEQQAHKIGFNADPETVGLGLYLLEELGVFQGYRWNDRRTQIVALRIGENIMRTKNLERMWDDFIQNQARYLEGQRSPERRQAYLRRLYDLANGDGGTIIVPMQSLEAGAALQFFNGETELVLSRFVSDGLIRRTDDKGSIALTPEGLDEVERNMASSRTGLVKRPSGASDSNAIFVVHGHDHGVKDTIARFLEKLGLEPVILHEQPNKGRTLIEKFEAYSDVRFAVVLLTPDDMGASAKDVSNQKSRARQNVILELGFFIGRLGRASVCPIYIEGVELPSDYHGVVYVPFDQAGTWRLQLAKELKAAGFHIDLGKAF